MHVLIKLLQPTELNKKILIYQVLPRLFNNSSKPSVAWGSIDDNGCGKLNYFSSSVLNKIQEMGFNYIWYTGVIRHATTTDYSSFGIPRQNNRVVKGRAGSPYAITDYYDIDPDLAENVANRMAEFEALIDRTHKAGLKCIIDFVPNHVAREYHSICKPRGENDLGETDDSSMNFSTRNNFYYCWGQQLDMSDVDLQRLPYTLDEPYVEKPAKATGNDCFSSRPQTNDWYETVKLNYGIDYCDAGGRSYHYLPIPDTWVKMKNILLFWAGKGVDGFRCDMAEMVPPEFWHFATSAIKDVYPNIIFIGEVYDQSKYHTYVTSGFDYLYDKVGMYDCLRAIIRNERPASAITYEWQHEDDIHDHMLYFLENHDEQRIASDFFAGDASKALPALIAAVCMRNNPFMVYAGQEYGERGMDAEGFSGKDGRTTIFDYWRPASIYKGFFNKSQLSLSEKQIYAMYHIVLRLANKEPALREGDFFDLMYVNPASEFFDPRHQFVFLRKKDNNVILVVVNFGDAPADIKVKIPGHAFDFLGLPEKSIASTDLLSGDVTMFCLKRDGYLSLSCPAQGGRLFKFNVSMKNTEYSFNEHNKEEFPPAHTAEHLLNQVMHRMFGCNRSENAHIERKKSKMSFTLPQKPTRQEERAIETEMNKLIEEDLVVEYEFVDRNHLPAGIDVSRIPASAGNNIRLVRIGDFDVCPCMGKHVRTTSQIGRFVMLGSNWDELTHTYRIRFKVIP